MTSEVTSVVIQSIMNKQSEANNKVKVQNLKIFSENEVKTCSVQEEKEKEEDQCWSILLQVLFKIRPCSHHIGFCSVSQNYTV